MNDRGNRPPGRSRLWRTANLVMGAALLTFCLAGWASSAHRPAPPFVHPHAVPGTASPLHPGPNEYGPNPNEVPK